MLGARGFPTKAVILSARGPKRFLHLGGGKRRICFCILLVEECSILSQKRQGML